jgi:hypothetical protein
MDNLCPVRRTLNSVSLLVIWRFPAAVRSKARVNCLLSHRQHVCGSEPYWRHGCKSTFFSIFIFCCVGGGLSMSPYSRKKVKMVTVKQFHYRPGQALRVPRGSGSQISRQSANEGGEFVSPTHRPPLPPGNIPMTPSGIEPATFRLLAQCLNQLSHRLPPLRKKESQVMSLIKGTQIFQKSRSHLKISCCLRAHTDDPQILRATVKI